MRPLVIPLILLTALCFGRQSPFATIAKMDFAKERVKVEQLRPLSNDQLPLVRGIIFGRHGRYFVEQNIRDYLNDQHWYRINPKFSNKLLNDVEKANLDVVRGEESARHEHVQPGDLRYWKAKKITSETLGVQRLIDLHVMACEIEAIHGRSFTDEPSIQKYFEDRYWYVASPKYDPKSLGPIERGNLTLLKKVEADRRKSAVSPGDMAAFENERIKPAQLKGVSLYDLRLLRNEIYARRGYHFYKQWLLDHFTAEEWYDPLPIGKEPPLTKVDDENVATILKQENALHEALLTKPISEDDLEGLYLEDAQKLQYEIMARHGKSFRDSWLKSYFTSLPWYKADPKYTNAMLSKIEKVNIAQIKKYQEHANSEFHTVEG